jgi:diguanylate cyclase (GGDEF)-like protein
MHIAGMSVPVSDDGKPENCIRLTVSVGVAPLDDTNRELTDLLAAADSALYLAKQAGRNRTHLANTSAPLTQVVPAARPAPPILNTPDGSRR